MENFNDSQEQITQSETKNPLPPHKQIPHWIVSGLAIASVVAYFVISYALGMWPFATLLPGFTPMSPLKTLGPPGYDDIQTTEEPITLGPTLDIVPDQNIPGWMIYHNEKYKFQISYPASWDIEEIDNQEPQFNIKLNSSLISINPRGQGREGPLGEIKKSSEQFTAEIANQNSELILDDGTPWMRISSNFINAPDNYNESSFIWGSVEIENRKSRCVDGNPQESCDGFSNGTIRTSGSVNQDQWDTVVKILSTFRFTK